ncbi:MAG: LD-carboxypeptidase [Crocinitomicaceae bacterium]
MIKPKALVPGDLIYITAPAKAIENTFVDYAVDFFNNQGFRVLVSPNCTGNFGYFSGSDHERTMDLQSGIDNEEVKAIICARGGYGSIRILDSLNWAAMLRQPKWLVGFSDITVFHHRLFNLGIQSIHGTMPINYMSNSPEALQTLMDSLCGREIKISYPTTNSAKHGRAEGTLIGGNLSIIYSLLATKDSFQFKDAILFIEDLSEQLYHLDRMLFALKKAGVFDLIKGLIIGGMTDMEDTTDSIGLSVQDIILQHFNFSKIPVAFDFPCGHFEDNRAMIIGANVLFSVSKEEIQLTYL